MTIYEAVFTMILNSAILGITSGSVIAIIMLLLGYKRSR